MTHIGKNIKKTRSIKGLSQQAFADLFNLTRGNISSYEESRAEPKIETVISIAKYFGIPLADFIEKDLSVNELLHYNTRLVIETEKLKTTQQLVKIPYIQSLYINDYIRHYLNDDYIQELPSIVIPNHSKLRLIAFEIDNQENLPAGFDYHNGDILILEMVVKENVHRIPDKLGMMINNEGLNYGVYRSNAGQIALSLNDWIKYPFDMESTSQYWVLKAYYKPSLY